MNSEIDKPDQKAELRARLVAERERLHDHQRRQLDRRICVHLLRFLDDRDCINLAGFHAFRGEPDLMPALEALHHAGRRVHLPVVNGQDMRFNRWTPRTKPCKRTDSVSPSRSRGTTCPPDRLEVVVMPAGGIFLRPAPGWEWVPGSMTGPFHSASIIPTPVRCWSGPPTACRKINSLPAQSWDVPLDAVITDRGLQMFRE